MNKYWWSFHKDCEHWEENGETIEQCIKMAKRCDIHNSYEFVYIGEIIQHMPFIDSISLVEKFMEEANEQYENVGYWLETIPHEDMIELQEELNEVLVKWLKKINQMPEFGVIEDIKSYKLKK